MALTRLPLTGPIRQRRKPRDRAERWAPSKGLGDPRSPAGTASLAVPVSLVCSVSLAQVPGAQRLSNQPCADGRVGTRYVSLRPAVCPTIRIVRSVSVCLQVENRKSNSAT